ncbi:hypothetical protein GCM10010381_25300 [Streptomyces xantholiticus]|nr:hypothetical protein GCM10010381_25300 [Streptomyces xantholiticus]
MPATTGQLAAYFERVRPELAAGPEARDVDDFLRRPPLAPALVPVRKLLWGRVAALAYDALPPYAHAPYGRGAPPADRVTRRLTATGNLLRCVPSRIRWQLPPGHILKAIARLGPGSRPAPYKLRRRAAILDRPGRAQHSDGGDSTRWRKPG